MVNASHSFARLPRGFRAEFREARDSAVIAGTRASAGKGSLLFIAHWLYGTKKVACKRTRLTPSEPRTDGNFLVVRVMQSVILPTATRGPRARPPLAPPSPAQAERRSAHRPPPPPPPPPHTHGAALRVGRLSALPAAPWHARARAPPRGTLSSGARPPAPRTTSARTRSRGRARRRAHSGSPPG